MRVNPPVHEMFTRAFQLAYFIYPDKPTSLEIATNALAKVEVAAAAQDKRLYYDPAGRTSAERIRRDRFRTKVSLGQLHLLQRLVYVESEPYERQMEQPGSATTVDEEDMIIHFIKHLVKISLRRNSFYVTLGFSRLLHNYSTAETMDIYNLVVQDPERFRDDYYYRSRKGRMMREIKERFGSLVNILRGHRGEERFQPQEHSDRHAGLVKECLNRFAPWATPCLVPAAFDPTTIEIPHLSFRGSDPDEEHLIEVNRIHAVLHPDCYQRLTESLALDSPDWRLEIPLFFLPDDRKNQKGSSGDRRHPPALNEEELSRVASQLAEQAARRRRFSAGLLRVDVDGVERARLDLDRASSIGFDVEESADLIEVIASYDRGDDVLLAAHVLTHADPSAKSRPLKSSIILEAGQEVSFSLIPCTDTGGEGGRLSAEITYRETNLRRAGLLSWRRFRRRVSDEIRGKRIRGAYRPGFALAFALLAILLIGLVLYTQMRNETIKKQQVAGTQQPTSNGEEKEPAPLPRGSTDGNDRQATADDDKEQPNEATTPQMAKPSRRRRNNLSGGQLARGPNLYPTRPGQDEPGSANGDATRALKQELAVRSLLAVKKIYIEVRGEPQLAASVHSRLLAELQVSNRFTTTEGTEAADAAFKVTVTRARANPREARENRAIATQMVVIVGQLVNSVGDIIWPLKDKSPSATYVGGAQKATTNMVKRLLDDIHAQERQR